MAIEEIHNGKLNKPKEEFVEQEEVLHARSAEVQDIIGRPPHWLVRGGITGFLGVLVLIFAVAAIIKYPTTITAPLRLTAINEPKTVKSKVNGKLVKLMAPNNSRAERGQVLGWIESTASHVSVLQLSAKVDSMYGWLKQNELDRIQSVQIERFSELGELQSSFKVFEQAYRTFITYLPGGFYQKKQRMLEKELQYKKELLKNLKKKKEIQNLNLKLANQKYRAQKILADKNLTAPLDLAKAKSNLAASRLPIQQTESAIINNHSSQVVKRNEWQKIKKDIEEQKAVFRQALNTLQSKIADWKTNYLLIAPISGKVIYAGIIQENQSLNAGQKIAYIKPPNVRYFGQMALSQHSFGKIHKGQDVLIRFNGYPSQEFGTVQGRVNYISAIPVQDSIFVAKVTFPEGLKTNYGKQLTPTNGINGTAEIITQDMTFLARIYNNLTSRIR